MRPTWPLACNLSRGRKRPQRGIYGDFWQNETRVAEIRVMGWGPGMMRRPSLGFMFSLMCGSRFLPVSEGMHRKLACHLGSKDGDKAKPQKPRRIMRTQLFFSILTQFLPVVLFAPPRETCERFHCSMLAPSGLGIAMKWAGLRERCCQRSAVPRGQSSQCRIAAKPKLMSYGCRYLSDASPPVFR